MDALRPDDGDDSIGMTKLDKEQLLTCQTLESHEDTSFMRDLDLFLLVYIQQLSS
jgi:hypothetical protein